MLYLIKYYLYIDYFDNLISHMIYYIKYKIHVKYNISYLTIKGLINKYDFLLGSNIFRYVVKNISFCQSFHLTLDDNFYKYLFCSCFYLSHKFINDNPLEYDTFFDIFNKYNLQSIHIYKLEILILEIIDYNFIKFMKNINSNLKTPS